MLALVKDCYADVSSVVILQYSQKKYLIIKENLHKVQINT